MPSCAPARARRSWQAAPLVLLLAACAAACTPAGPPDRTGTAPAASSHSPAAGPVAVQISQRRGQEAKRRFILQVANTSGRPLVIEAAAVRSVLYDGDAAWVPVRAGGTRLGPGRTVSLAVDLPAPHCRPPESSSAPPRSDAAEPGPEAGAVLTVDGGSGPARLQVAAPDPFGVLARSHNQDCLAEAVGRIASLSLDPQLKRAGSRTARSAIVSVRIVPAGGTGTLSIESPAPTTLLGEDPDHPWPRGIVVAGRDAPRTLELHIVPARCDAHAVAEDRLGTKLPLRLTAGGYRGVLRLEPPPELARAVYSFITAACRTRQDGGQ
ncbi:hypothetical protein [Arthrobacter mobilis]|uniref:Uncharacterized protein n=1 Tax=Arthrobacter mobilis TaxID=2724944 RepID=A0A7X6HD07_9MICC|nr:hypothetical protein [Arthrobacter mobilis]NKX53969.1 hypothetical protein [Arthrobacter mobilis]